MNKKQPTIDGVLHDIMRSDDYAEYKYYEEHYNEVKSHIENLMAAARLDEANKIDDGLYDLNKSDWGIPTKWSKEQYGEEQYADLWTPNEAIHKFIHDRIAELEKAMKGENDE